jgi:hypothetical protein
MKKLLLLLIFSFSFYCKAQTFSINFDTPDTLAKIDTTLAGNIWQKGQPSKVFFNSALSAPNAIVTDTVNYYPTNNRSVFTVHVYDGTWVPDCIMLSFSHKFNTDTLLDGGYVENSYDGGNTWINVANDSNVGTFNWTNSVLPDGNKAFCGHRNWMYSQIGWYEYPFDILTRFVFTSDGIQTNKEGWMIDDIMYGFLPCTDVNEIGTIIDLKISPNPAHDKLNVECKLPDAELKIYDMTGRMVQEEKLNYQLSTVNCQLSSGVYFVRVIAGEKSSVQKLVVE